MRTRITAAAIAASLVLTPVAANAQQRLTDGVLGAAAGAAVGGPIGAAVGGVIGFVHGPRIAHGLGFDHRCYRHCYAYYPYGRHHHYYR